MKASKAAKGNSKAAAAIKIAKEKAATTAKAKATEEEAGCKNDKGS